MEGLRGRQEKLDEKEVALIDVKKAFLVGGTGKGDA